MNNEVKGVLTMCYHCAFRFHPDHIQEFLAMRRKKNDGWKCDVSFDLFYFMKHNPKKENVSYNGHSIENEIRSKLLDPRFRLQSYFEGITHIEPL